MTVLDKTIDTINFHTYNFFYEEVYTGAYASRDTRPETHRYGDKDTAKHYPTSILNT